MAGIGFSLKGDFFKLGDLQRKLSRLGKRQMLERMSKSLAEETHSLVMQGFDSSRSPNGVAWKPVLGRPGGKPLLDTGRLKNSITAQSSMRSFEVSTNVIYAAIHQYGGVIQAKTPRGLIFKTGGPRGGKTQRRGGKPGAGESWVRVQSVTIPARPFLPSRRKPPTKYLQAWIRVAKDEVALAMGGLHGQ